MVFFWAYHGERERFEQPEWSPHVRNELEVEEGLRQKKTKKGDVHVTVLVMRSEGHCRSGHHQAPSPDGKHCQGEQGSIADG